MYFPTFSQSFVTGHVSFIPGFEISYPSVKLLCWNFIRRTCIKFQIQIRICILREKTSYPGRKLPTQGENFLPREKTSYPGRKLLTRKKNFLQGRKTSYLQGRKPSYSGRKLPTQGENFLPGCKTWWEKPTSSKCDPLVHWEEYSLFKIEILKMWF
jgi:hypothetical protein